MILSSWSHRKPTRSPQGRPTRPNHRQHLSRHRPQQPRRVASQRSPRAAARPSSTSRSPLAESRRTDLEFACSRRCVSEAFLRTPKATELGSAGIRGRFEQAQRQSTRAPPHSTQKEVLTGRHLFSPDATYKSANAPRAGSRSRRMKRSREFGMRTVSAIGRSGTPLTYPPSRKQRRLSRSPHLGSAPRLTELPRIIEIAQSLTATILTEWPPWRQGQDQKRQPARNQL